MVVGSLRLFHQTCVTSVSSTVPLATIAPRSGVMSLVVAALITCTVCTPLFLQSTLASLSAPANVLQVIRYQRLLTNAL